MATVNNGSRVGGEVAAKVSRAHRGPGSPIKRADATRADLFCLDDMRLDALLPVAHGDMLALRDRPIIADRHQPQQVSRNHQALIGGLAIFAEPRPNVHRVAEIGELTLGVAAFADDYRAGVQAGPEGWRNASAS